VDDYLSVLEREFVAEDGSFLLQLRVQLTWDKAAFTRLTSAMLACCQAFDKGDLRPSMEDTTHYTALVPRWLAEGFWCVGRFVESWTMHPAWDQRRAAEPEYYRAAYERLFLLAEWFFIGQCPSLDPSQTFAPM
jgi:hypothetical protein